MASEPIRSPIMDQLLTPQNAAFINIDYQPIQVSSIGSMDRQLLVDNIVRVAQIARAYALPTVLSTVNVTTGINKPLIRELRELFPRIEPLDRTTVNSWEDREIRLAVEATGRRKLIMTALWTEVCLVFPALDALREGYEVYPVVDAVGGTSVEAHRAGLERLVQAGARPVSWVQLICELQRDWVRTETVPAFRAILFSESSPVIQNERAGTALIAGS